MANAEVGQMDDLDSNKALYADWIEERSGLTDNDLESEYIAWLESAGIVSSTKAYSDEIEGDEEGMEEGSDVHPIEMNGMKVQGREVNPDLRARQPIKKARKLRNGETHARDRRLTVVNQRSEGLNGRALHPDLEHAADARKTLDQLTELYAAEIMGQGLVARQKEAAAAEISSRYAPETVEGDVDSGALRLKTDRRAGKKYDAMGRK